MGKVHMVTIARLEECNFSKSHMAIMPEVVSDRGRRKCLHSQRRSVLFYMPVYRFLFGSHAKIGTCMPTDLVCTGS